MSQAGTITVLPPPAAKGTAAKWRAVLRYLLWNEPAVGVLSGMLLLLALMNLTALLSGVFGVSGVFGGYKGDLGGDSNVLLGCIVMMNVAIAARRLLQVRTHALVPDLSRCVRHALLLIVIVLTCAATLCLRSPPALMLPLACTLFFVYSLLTLLCQSGRYALLLVSIGVLAMIALHQLFGLRLLKESPLLFSFVLVGLSVLMWRVLLLRGVHGERQVLLSEGDALRELFHLALGAPRAVSNARAAARRLLAGDTADIRLQLLHNLLLSLSLPLLATAAVRALRPDALSDSFFARFLLAFALLCSAGLQAGALNAMPRLRALWLRSGAGRAALLPPYRRHLAVSTLLNVAAFSLTAILLHQQTILSPELAALFACTPLFTLPFSVVIHNTRLRERGGLSWLRRVFALLLALPFFVGPKLTPAVFAALPLTLAISAALTALALRHQQHMLLTTDWRAAPMRARPNSEQE